MNCPSCGQENIDGNDRCENCLAPFRDLDVPRADSAEGLARSVMEDNLRELDTDEAICVGPDTPALEVARLMKNSNCGCALVVDGGKLVGIFTEHDVLLQMSDSVEASLRGRPGWVEKGAPTEERPYNQDRPGKLQFVEPMITDTTADTTNEATALVEEMQLNAMPFGEIPVEEMRADAMTMTETETHQAPVKDTLSNRRDINDTPVRNLMTTKPEVLHETDSVAEALNKMSLGRYRHIPFVKSDGTYGVASIKSVLKYIAQEDW
jgi:CBS domain-containing protein